MTDQTATADPAPAPSHYEIVLAQPYLIPGTTVTIRAGRVTVIADVADAMPAGIVLSKTPAVA